MATNSKALKKTLGNEVKKLSKGEKFVYDYLSEKDVSCDKVLNEILPDVYKYSYPKHTITYKQMLDFIKKNKIESGNEYNDDYRLMFKDEETGKQYMYPCDFYYIPQPVLLEIWENRKKAYRLTDFWRKHLKTLMEFLFEEGGAEDVYVINKWAPENKGYSKLKEIFYKLIGKKKNWVKIRRAKAVKPLKYYIGSWAANKVKKIIDNYRSYYKFDNNSEGIMSWAFLSTPTCNPETVVKAWKARGIDVPLPDDNLWYDQYEYSEWLDYKEQISSDEVQLDNDAIETEID